MDCLQLQTRRVTEKDEDDTTVAVELFDFGSPFVEAMTDAGLGPDVLGLVQARFEQARNSSNM